MLVAVFIHSIVSLYSSRKAICFQAYSKTTPYPQLKYQLLLNLSQLSYFELFTYYRLRLGSFAHSSLQPVGELKAEYHFGSPFL